MKSIEHSYVVECINCRRRLIVCGFPKKPIKYRTCCETCMVGWVVTLTPSTNGCFWPVNEEWREEP